MGVLGSLGCALRDTFDMELLDRNAFRSRALELASFRFRRDTSLYDKQRIEKGIEWPLAWRTSGEEF